MVRKLEKIGKEPSLANRFYTKMFYERWGDWKLKPREIQDMWIQEGAYLLENLIEDGHALSVGPGDGRDIGLLRNKASRIMGIDKDIMSLELARQNCMRYFGRKGYDRVDFFLGDITKENNLPPETFDYAVCIGNTFGTLGTYDNKIKALLEMKRLLKVDGDIFISVYSEKSMNEPLRSKRKEFYNNLGINIEHEDRQVMYSKKGKEVSESFTPQEFNDFAKKTELKLMESRPLGEIAYMFWLKKSFI
jgi:ubiquinone/menaquinone biosynthesis C-methylase UbiE